MALSVLTGVRRQKCGVAAQVEVGCRLQPAGSDRSLMSHDVRDAEISVRDKHHKGDILDKPEMNRGSSEIWAAA